MKKQHDSFFEHKENIRQRIFDQLKDCKGIFQILKGQNPIFNRFIGWIDVIDFVEANEIWDSTGDTILTHVLKSYQQESDGKWPVVLTAFCWPILERLYKKCYKYDSDLIELWSNIYWLFLEKTKRIDLHEHSIKLASYIYYLIFNNIYEQFEKSWDYQKRKQANDPDRFDIEDIAVRDESFEEVEIAIDLGKFEDHIRNCHRSGLISEFDMNMLIATQIYKEPLKDYAERHGLDYERIKKRRQRAKEIIKNNSDFLSPE